MTELRELPLTRLILIPYADYQHHEPVRLADHDDLGLSEDGRDQATRLQARLSATQELAGTTRLLSSSARRAKETAAIIAPALGEPPVSHSCAFCDPHSGECVGMPVAEFQATLGKKRAENWSPYAPKSPGGESVRVGMERAARGLVEAVLDDAGGTIVVVTHTMPLRAALWIFLDLPFLGHYQDLDIAYTGITEWRVDGWLPGIGQMKANLIRYNDSAHLLDGAWT